MIELIPFLVCGLLLLGVLLLAIFRKSARSNRTIGAHDADEDFAALRLRIRGSEALAERIFALEDWRFVSGENDAEVGSLLERERKTVAKLLIKRMREQLAEVMRLHRIVARQSPGLSVSKEARLVFEYCLFLALYGFLFALIQVRGPFRPRQLAGSAVRAMARSSRLLASALFPNQAWNGETAKLPSAPRSNSRWMT